jgi:hypothetical protein
MFQRDQYQPPNEVVISQAQPTVLFNPQVPIPVDTV